MKERKSDLIVVWINPLMVQYPFSPLLLSHLPPFEPKISNFFHFIWINLSPLHNWVSSTEKQDHLRCFEKNEGSDVTPVRAIEKEQENREVTHSWKKKRLSLSGSLVTGAMMIREKRGKSSSAKHPEKKRKKTNDLSECRKSRKKWLLERWVGLKSRKAN